MSDFNKNLNGRDITCKSHSARSDRAELYRICPSKLSKRELEDLYFALLENNLELKRTLNGQQDKIKWLSTKVQRLTNTQKSAQGKETKECCVATKSVLNEQKDSMMDLKNANERMAERIRLLNMRLCSAKQFLKRTPNVLQAASHYNKCTTAPVGSYKNSSMSALNTKRSEGNLKPASSCQLLEKEVTSTRSVETDTHEGDRVSNKTCDENKCRTLMEELKQKIVNLEEELSKTHEEYSCRISRLEREVSDVRNENVAVRSERGARADQLEARCNELTMQLSIEKRKVAELEMQLRAANKSNSVVKSIEDHFAAVNKATATPSHFGIKSATDENETKQPKSTDDSGYTDASKSQDLVDDKGLNSLSEDLLKKITDLESQLDNLKVSTAAEMLQEKRVKSFDTEWTEPEGKGLCRETEGLENKFDETSARGSDKSVFMHPRVETMTENSSAEVGDDKTCPNIELSGNVNMASDIPGTSKQNDGYSGTNKEILSESACLAPQKGEKDKATSNNSCSNNSSSKIQDNHNKLQIPGPIPTDTKDWKKNMFKQLSVEVKTKNRQKKTKKDGETKNQTVKPGTSKIPTRTRQNSKELDSTKFTNETTNTAATVAKVPKAINSFDPDVYKNEVEKNVNNIHIYTDVDETVVKTDVNKIKAESAVAKTEDNKRKGNATADQIIVKSGVDKTKVDAVNKPNVDAVVETYLNATVEANICATDEQEFDRDDLIQRDSVGKDSLDVNRSRLMHFKADASGVKDNGTSLSNFYPRPESTLMNPPGIEEQNISAVEKSQFDLCASRSRVCTCPQLRRHAPLLRTCSGSLRLRTPREPGRFKACACALQLDHAESVHEGTQAPKPTQPGRIGQRSPTTDRGTYSIRSVPEVQKQARATSPENTDCEISSMTDLPSEKDAKSPRPPLSPGEDKATTTYTDSYTTPATTDYGSLSEGELPAQTGRRVSLGEQPRGNDFVPPEATSSQKMEATLQAITEELAHCKQLLMAQKPEQRDAAASASPSPRALALRRATAAQHIGSAQLPKCVFTLHIGTIVLSDEAVLNSRNKTLVLSWKFYDQNVAMTRMRAGRVVLFDFSTEYEVNITDDFLNYMKHGEMPIVICELNKQDEPFASCALPLRDALLHTNRRADMSLALVGGAWQREGGAADALDSGDELGVLDLWCMLRAEPQQLPAINRAIAKPSQLPEQHAKTPNMMDNTRILEQVVEDEQSTEARISQDLEFTLGGHSRPKRLSGLTANTQATRSNIHRLSAISVNKTTNTPIDTFKSDCLAYDATKYPEGRRQRGYPRRSKTDTLSDRMHSGIIINEVQPNIKSSFDMKQALERNDNRNGQYGFARLPKKEDDSLQPHASVSSFKTVLAKLQKKHPKRENAEQPDSELTRGPHGMLSDDIPPRKSDEDSEIHRKYDNIMKTIGSNRPEPLKKSVTIIPSGAELAKDEPQKDTEVEDSCQQTLTITVMWLALNEECEAMVNPHVQRLFVAYSFLGRSGAELETPVSLPKPKHYVDKCYFNFKKTFQLDDVDLPLLGHMARCRAASKTTDPKDCIVFTVVSEPPEDPLGLENCEDIGCARLCLGDVLASAGGGGGYTEAVAVRGARDVLGVLCVRVDGLAVLRRCLRRADRICPSL